MVIGDFAGYSSLGLGSLRQQSLPNAGRNAVNRDSASRNPVTLDAKVDPQKSNEYSVEIAKPVIAPPEKTSDVKNAAKRAPQNTDPVSRVFNAVAESSPRISRIDIFV